MTVRLHMVYNALALINNEFGFEYKIMVSNLILKVTNKDFTVDFFFGGC